MGEGNLVANCNANEVARASGACYFEPIRVVARSSTIASPTHEMPSMRFLDNPTIREMVEDRC